MIPLGIYAHVTIRSHALPVMPPSVSDAGGRASSGPLPIRGRLKPRLKDLRPRNLPSQVCRDIGVKGQ